MFSSPEWSFLNVLETDQQALCSARFELSASTAVALPSVRKAISMIRREPSLVALHPRVAISWWSYRNCQNSQDGIGDLCKTTFCLLQTKLVYCIQSKCRGFGFIFKSANHQLLHFPNQNRKPMASKLTKSSSRSSLENQVHKQRCDYDKAPCILKYNGFCWVSQYNFGFCRGYFLSIGGSTAKTGTALLECANCRRRHSFRRCRRPLPSFPASNVSWNAKSMSFLAADDHSATGFWCESWKKHVQKFVTGEANLVNLHKILVHVISQAYPESMSSLRADKCNQWIVTARVISEVRASLHHL